MAESRGWPVSEPLLQRPPRTPGFAGLLSLSLSVSCERRFERLLHGDGGAEGALGSGGCWGSGAEEGPVRSPPGANALSAHACGGCGGHNAAQVYRHSPLSSVTAGMSFGAPSPRLQDLSWPPKPSPQVCGPPPGPGPVVHPVVVARPVTAPMPTSGPAPSATTTPLPPRLACSGQLSLGR